MRHRSILLRASAAFAVAVLAANPPLRAQAGSDAGGTLAFAPAAPPAGAEVRVTYRAGAPLQGQPRLALRARLRTPGDQEAYVGAIGSETRRLAVLERGADGLHRASFRLPDSVVYALVVVETLDGAALDTRGNQGWELMAHAPEGWPLSAALEQRARDLTRRNVPLGLETAREHARLYPGAPALLSLRSYERFAGGDSVFMDAARVDYARLSRELEQRGGLTADETAAMWRLARAVEDGTGIGVWETRLVRGFPRHPDALSARMDQALALLPPMALGPQLDSLEALWNDGGVGHEYLLNRAFNLAMQTGDSTLVGRWGARVDRHVPIARPMLARALLARPGVGALGVEHARRRIAMLRTDVEGERDLFTGTAAYRDQANEQAAELLAALGQALLAEGRAGAARDTLALAGTLGWDAPVLHRVADAQLAAGDTARALLTFARIAADPGAGPAFGDSVAAVAGRRFAAGAWARAVAEARGALRERVLRGSVARPLAGAAGLTDAAGKPVALQALLSSAPATVVVFGSTWCGYTRQALPGIRALAERLAAEGGRLVLITQQEPSDDVERIFRDGSTAMTVLYDPRRASHSAFGSASTPEYFVVDGGGRIRFQYGTLGEIPRQVAVLRAAP